MKSTLLSAILTMLAITTASPVERATPTDFKSQMLASHNYFRDQHSANPLTWDNSLAASSQTWANTCNFSHDSAGENLVYRTSAQYWGQFVNMWGTERTKYNFDKPDFSAATGHFTQLVWKNTKTVGCAWSKCDGGSGKAIGYYVVCKYSPPGNYLGQFSAQVGRQTKGSPGDVFTT
ncbi:hypothetical protein E4U42_005624 [Claviceps africana]|uniref:SCP domain-containing protein n=1 Tax=Claviceps africana TaxID=83212 RepID=A0A8K0NG88_9HYPO|nr:hypothetical protein E4U42_005624 [Claviceps africana]